MTNEKKKLDKFYTSIVKIIFETEIQKEIYKEIEEATNLKTNKEFIILLNDYYFRNFLDEDIKWRDLSQNETGEFINLRIVQLINIGKILLIQLYKQYDEEKNKFNEKKLYEKNFIKESFEDENKNFENDNFSNTKIQDFENENQKWFFDQDNYKLDENLLSPEDRESYKKLNELINKKERK